MFFSQSPISSYKEPFHKKGNPQKGFAPSFPIPELQSKKHPILSHKAFIPCHSAKGMGKKKSER